MSTREDFIWKMGGQQGEGIESGGEILSNILAKQGYSLFSQRLFASRIKGGHTTFGLRIAIKTVETIGSGVDCLVALDQETIDKHGAEVRAGGVIIADSKCNPNFDAFAGHSIACLSLAITATAIKHGALQMKNIVALGMSVAVLGFPIEEFNAAIAAKFVKKSQKVVDSNIAAFAEGVALVEAANITKLETLPQPEAKSQLFLLGNEAAALGAVAAGSRFMASYPITPASEVMEYMLKEMRKIGATVVQTEDEIAACMAAMGGAYAGVRGFTCTSGPGISLMAESLSMASIAEIPVVIIDVMRSGPSTGMATKVEQSDIMAAVYNAHGDYSHIVLAATSIEDSFYSIQEAFNLAERFQCPVLFLTDLQQGLNKQTVPIFDMTRIGIDRGELLKEADLPALEKNEYFKRFALTESGISPRTIPGMKNGFFLSTGLEHTEEGKPAEAPSMHIAQTEKRFHKLDGVADYIKPFYADVESEDCDVLVISMTSVNGAVGEAVEELRGQGKKVNALRLRLIAPFPVEKLLPYYEKAKKVLIIEQNATAQLASLFRMNMPNKEKVESFVQYTGDPVSKQEAIDAITEVL